MHKNEVNASTHVENTRFKGRILSHKPHLCSYYSKLSILYVELFTPKMLKLVPCLLMSFNQSRVSVCADTNWNSLARISTPMVRIAPLCLCGCPFVTHSLSLLFAPGGYACWVSFKAFGKVQRCFSKVPACPFTPLQVQTWLESHQSWVKERTRKQIKCSVCVCVFCKLSKTTVSILSV